MNLLHIDYTTFTPHFELPCHSGSDFDILELMSINVPQFPSIDVPLKKVYSRLGYAQGITEIDTATKEMIEDEMYLAKKLIVPKQVVVMSKIEFTDINSVILDKGFCIESNSVYELLLNCTQAVGFAVTIGSHLEEKRNIYIENKEPSRALILDAIGSETADFLAELTHEQIKADAEKACLETTRRFSPGYGDWGLFNQKDFLSWLGAENIGIVLNKYFQMSPEKSVSAILGIYK